MAQEGNGLASKPDRQSSVYKIHMMTWKKGFLLWTHVPCGTPTHLLTHIIKQTNQLKIEIYQQLHKWIYYKNVSSPPNAIYSMWSQQFSFGLWKEETCSQKWHHHGGVGEPDREVKEESPYCQRAYVQDSATWDPNRSLHTVYNQSWAQTAWPWQCSHRRKGQSS